MNILEELDRRGAVMRGRHFVYKSGKHGAAYINLDPVLPDLELMKTIGEMLAEPFMGKADVVAAPATGGIPLAIMTALAMSDRHLWAPAVWADKAGGGFAFERAGFAELLEGRDVLVVEDLLTTGGSVASVIAAAKSHGANIVGVSAICNRGGVSADSLGVGRLEALTEVSFVAYDPADCPFCQRWVAIVVNIGHGAEFQEAFPNYPGGYVRA